MVIAMSTPKTIIPMPSIEPMVEVTRVAQRRLPFHCQSSERSTRPPSRGKAGTMLKRTRNRLRLPVIEVTAVTAAGQPAARPTAVRIRKLTPSRTLTTGPAAATRNSVRAVGGSSLISATPPKTNSVMPRIGTSWRFAITACPSSWSTMQANSSSAPARPIAQ